VITARGEQRLRTGHPWIYRADVADVDAAGGDIVEVIGPRRRTLGHALFSDRSQIPIRMLARGDTPFDASMLRARLARAIQFRDSLAIDATAYRVVHGEADLLPSLVIDRYGELDLYSIPMSSGPCPGLQSVRLSLPDIGQYRMPARGRVPFLTAKECTRSPGPGYFIAPRRGIETDGLPGLRRPAGVQPSQPRHPQGNGQRLRGLRDAP